MGQRLNQGSEWGFPLHYFPSPCDPLTYVCSVCTSMPPAPIPGYINSTTLNKPQCHCSSSRRAMDSLPLLHSLLLYCLPPTVLLYCSFSSSWLALPSSCPEELVQKEPLFKRSQSRISHKALCTLPSAFLVGTWFGNETLCFADYWKLDHIFICCLMIDFNSPMVMSQYRCLRSKICTEWCWKDWKEELGHSCTHHLSTSRFCDQ